MKNQGHIDVVTKYFYPVTAGIETNILETYSELVRLGWKVTVHTTADTLNAKNALSKTDQIRGITIMRYPSGVPGYIPSISYSTSQLICLHNFNIFPHLLIYMTVFFRRLLGLKTPRIFLTPHGGFTPEWPTFPLIPRILKQLYHISIGRWLINTQTGLIRAISLWERHALVHAGVQREKIVLIINGLDKAAVQNHEKHANSAIKGITRSLGKYFVAVGRIAPIKNYETMIRAMSKHPGNTTLAIIGPVQDETYYENLKHLAQTLGVSRRIKFLGTLHGSDKYYVIGHALCQIHLARWESFCNVVYEAKSLGQICVVANNTALTSLIRNNVNGFVTETFNDDQLAKILDYIQNADHSSTIQKMRDTLKRESYPVWDVSARKMHRYYRTLIQNL